MSKKASISGLYTPKAIPVITYKRALIRNKLLSFMLGSNQGFEMGGEVAQQLRRRDDAVARQRSFRRGYLLERGDHIIQVTLGIDPARDCQPDQLQLRIEHLASLWVRMGEHDRANLHGAYAALQVKLNRQRLPGEMALGEMGEKPPGVDVHRVTAGWLYDWDPGFEQTLCQVSGLPKPVIQVIYLQTLAQPGGNGV